MRKRHEFWPGGPGRGWTFVVRLRNTESRTWRNQSEVVADPAINPAKWAAQEKLVSAHGDRSTLRARVWQTAFATHPDMLFHLAS